MLHSCWHQSCFYMHTIHMQCRAHMYILGSGCPYELVLLQRMS